MTYSRVGDTTMGPGCLTAVFGMGTGVATPVCSPEGSEAGPAVARPAVVAKGSGKGVALHGPARAWWRGGGVKAVKRSAVSTGPLRRLPAVHARPIDLVVCQEPSPRRAGDLVWKGVSRLD